MYQYPVKFEDHEGTVILTFPDFPETATEGKDRTEALSYATGCLEEAIAARITDREEIPTPSRAGRRPVVTLPTLTAAKVMVYQAMREKNIHRANLARRLNVDPQQVRRLLDVHHASQLGQIDAALGALGKRLVLEVEDTPGNTGRTE
jgi:antitoxin HicB|tara:strand:+ start:37 stop:480 length:444 start_codon:yes stop_codon:yes gene_type:complete